MVNADDTHDANAIHPLKVSSRLGLPLHQIIQALATRLLHTLKAEFDVDGQRLLVLVVVLENIEPAKDRALVIRCSSPNKLPILFVHDQGEGIGVPTVGFERLSHDFSF